MPSPIRVTIWNEFVHERQNPSVAQIYPKGIHGALAEALGTNADFIIRTATLEEPEQGRRFDQWLLDLGLVMAGLEKRRGGEVA
jgi:trehalose utilization protein